MDATILGIGFGNGRGATARFGFGDVPPTVTVWGAPFAVVGQIEALRSLDRASSLVALDAGGDAEPTAWWTGACAALGVPVAVLRRDEWAAGVPKSMKVAFVERLRRSLTKQLGGAFPVCRPDEAGAVAVALGVGMAATAEWEWRVAATRAMGAP